jgi:CBS domain-containing protein
MAQVYASRRRTQAPVALFACNRVRVARGYHKRRRRERQPAPPVEATLAFARAGRADSEAFAMQQLKDVMSRDVKMVTPETTIREAAQQMRDGDFGMLPVAENDRMIGAISDRDIAVRAVADDKGPETPVRDVMSRGICWAYEDDSVDVAARLMSERQIRRLPVVNRDKRLVGIVSLGDLAIGGAEEQSKDALKAISES